MLQRIQENMEQSLKYIFAYLIQNDNKHQTKIENDAFIGLMMDLQGPKIRIGSFKTEKIELKKGDQFTLDAGLSENDGDQSKVGLAYKQLPSDLNSGNTLLLDDGKIILEVKKISGDKIITQVSQGGVLSNNKGINLRGGGLSASALTEKDNKFDNLLFLLGLILGPIIYSLFTSKEINITISNSFILLIFAGLLVGIGTRISRGCTSGHGISGIGRFSLRSIIATLTFMVVGVLTVLIKNFI